MKTCKDFKDLVLLDHFDGEADVDAKAWIASHAAACPGCRSFLVHVQQGLKVPFEKAVREPVPAGLWSSIREKIVEQEVLQEEPGFFERFWGMLAPVPSWAPALASVLVVVALSGAVFYGRQATLAKENSRVEYLAQLFSTDAGSQAAGAKDMVEEYFL
jgi:hypothetical protein